MLSQFRRGPRDRSGPDRQRSLAGEEEERLVKFADQVVTDQNQTDRTDIDVPSVSGIQ